MIFKRYNELKDLSFDAIIIGSGPAGLSLALDLEKKKIHTLIIEAGNNKYTDESQEFYEGNVIGDDYPELSKTRLRQFGGTSGHWGGVCRTLEKHNFENWPIKKSDLEPYSTKAAKIINLKRNNFFNKRISKNFDVINFEVSPLRFKNKYINQIKKSKYISLIVNSFVVELFGENKKIKEVKFFNDNKYYNLNANFFILACGGIENSRLMLLIKKKYPNLIDKKMPIGNYWLEHPYNHVAEAFIDIENFNKFLKKKSLENIIKINCDIWFSIAPNLNFIKKNNLLDSVMNFHFIYTDFNVQKKTFIKKLKCVAPEYVRKVLIKNNNKAITARISVQTSQILDFHNKIILNENKKDPLGINQSLVYWKKSENVRKTYRNNIESLGKFFIDKEIGRVAAEDFLYSQKPFDNPSGGHHMGGTRMGFNPSDSVVDKNLKVHDIVNLYICGSSVFPSVGYANPTFTIVQLSTRLSDHLSEKIKRKNI